MEKSLFRYVQFMTAKKCFSTYDRNNFTFTRVTASQAKFLGVRRRNVHFQVSSTNPSKSQLIKALVIKLWRVTVYDAWLALHELHKWRKKLTCFLFPEMQ